jgi:cell division protein ZapA
MSKGSERGGSTQVEIYGSSYVVRGEHEREEIQELAALVDSRMREIAKRLPGAGADAGRLAILVALNLADELQRLRKQQEGERGEIEARVTELTRELGVLLEG